MSESTGKLSVSRENVWVVRWVVFLFDEFSKPIVFLFWRKSRVEVNIDVGIAASKKKYRRNEGGGHHIPSSETEGIASSASAAAAHQIRVFTRFRVRKTKENRSGSHSASGPAHGTDASPVHFGPTRTRTAALVSALHACSRLGLTCTAARLRQIPRLGLAA